MAFAGTAPADSTFLRNPDFSARKDFFESGFAARANPQPETPIHGGWPIQPPNRKTNIMKSFVRTLAAVMALASVTAIPAMAGEKKDIVDTAVAAGSFKTLAAALGAAGLVDTLKGTGPFTVFAPTDEAFGKLPAGTVENLLKPENKQKLVDILTYHVVSGKVESSTAKTLEKATALNKKDIKVKLDGDTLLLNDAKVIKADIEASNGVIHVIDSVLLPPADKK
jgi:uncharacterized surface protein with fasciclin (FAS1) repeats